MIRPESRPRHLREALAIVSALGIAAMFGALIAYASLGLEPLS